MLAYVLGRPIPFSSSSFTSVASVKQGGGCVKCCSGLSSRSLRISPSVKGGSCLGPSAFAVGSFSDLGPFLRGVVVPAFFVDREKTVELQHRATSAQHVAPRLDLGDGLVEDRWRHLRGDEAVPR